jgi:predicted ATPase
VTFLFTDIEGSTLRWEVEPELMRVALATHDEVLRSAIDGQGGWLFKHTGDGMCAAFSSPHGAIDAATAAQRQLALPVRMGISSGEAYETEGDYFGPVLNRAARVMHAAHGGQVLVAASTAALVDGVDLIDLGEHRLRDLAAPTRLFQVRAPGLAVSFPPLRTLDRVPGNLPVMATSFIGRDQELKRLVELIREHRLVTLTGVGGVGKTRLAVQVAAELVLDFSDGVWLVELAPVADPDAVPDVVATALGVTALSGTVTDSIVNALAGRRLLLVVDNCEHVLDAVAPLLATIVAATSSVTVLATSREALGVAGEHRWPVPPFPVDEGARSPAVELFTERARAQDPEFQLDTDATTVVEICRRVDGIALAIELAAARMVSMTPQDLIECLDDRFRVLSGPPRGGGRHQTLIQSVQWSYELLGEAERRLLDRCSVFYDGFDPHSAAYLVDGLDQYAVFDLLDSLVRKSLVTVERHGGHARYGMLETIRQYAHERLAADGDGDDVRDRHAAFFAREVQRHWEQWEGPDQDAAIEWNVVELANLRAAFHWARDRDDLATATTIAAHATLLGWAEQRFEPVGWAEEILDAATAADVPQLPRLYTAASLCNYLGRPRDGLDHSDAALRLEAAGQHDPFELGWSGVFQAVAHLYAGRTPRAVEILAELSTSVTTAGQSAALGCYIYLLPAVGRSDDALAVADDAVELLRSRGSLFILALVLLGHGRAIGSADPDRALKLLREAHELTRAHPFLFMESLVARDTAGLEARHGDADRALELLDDTIATFHRAGQVANVVGTIATLAMLFDRLDRPEAAATLVGLTTDRPRGAVIVDLPGLVERLRSRLGPQATETAIASGGQLDLAGGVRYALQQIAIAQRERLQA